MDFNLLKEFLKSGLTRSAFAKGKGRKDSIMGTRLYRQMEDLQKIGFIDPKVFGYSTAINTVKKHRAVWLKAIEAYEASMQKAEEPDKSDVQGIKAVLRTLFTGEYEHLNKLPFGDHTHEIDFEMARHIQSGDYVYHPSIDDYVKVNDRHWNIDERKLILTTADY